MINIGKPTAGGEVRLTFVLPPEQVPGPTSVVGDFNDWNPFAHPLRPAEDGTFQATATVRWDRELCFRYLAAGGHWFDDPDADRYDEHGGHVIPSVRLAQAAESADADLAHGGFGGVDLGPSLERTSFGPVATAGN
ncbi:isoamylase early set domain-containing protein [Thermopolyspora sp. NPDC052614]|uniref:isoamylase early set domain-containing protein n=1 Tax=Thermopolyspora sp. NPDC052614 TaxID=3155682 RepID=UPI0034454F1C